LSNLCEPHLASNKYHHHGEAFSTFGSMGLVDPLIQRKANPSEVLAEAAVEEFGII
jgi:hypothetical protein